MSVDTVVQVQDGAGSLLLPHVPRPGYPAYVIDVGRPVVPWRWTSIVLAPIELLALAWSVPFVILLVMVPIGLGIASVLWVARLILRL